MAENSDNQEFVFLEGEEVVRLDEKTYKLLDLYANEFKNLYLVIHQLPPVIIKKVQYNNNLKDKLFRDGIDIECEILRTGKKWQKGKIKVELTVKFYPDEPEAEIEENEAENSGDNNSEKLETEVSPLDDLRQKFNQDNK